MDLIDKFTPLDKIFENISLLEDNMVIKILEAHQKLEERYVTDENHSASLEIPVLGEEFHKENMEIIKYVIDNIDIGFKKIDALFYLYPFLIYRYSNNDWSEALPSLKKFQYYLTTLQLAFNTKEFNVAYLSSGITRFFLYRSSSIFLQEHIESIISASYNNWMIAFRHCSILLYDKVFSVSFYPYEGAMHSGSYILFDIILHKILFGRSDIKKEWIDKYVDFFEKNKEIEFGSIPQYYILFAKLIRCQYLLFDQKKKKK